METFVKSGKYQAKLNDKLLEFEKTNDVEFIGSCILMPKYKEYNLNVHMFNTLKMTEDVYKKWEELLGKLYFEENHFSIRCYCDCSGYEYWLEENENNISSIQIYTNDELNIVDVDSIIYYLTHIIKVFEDFKELHKL